MTSGNFLGHLELDSRRSPRSRHAIALGARPEILQFSRRLVDLVPGLQSSNRLVDWCQACNLVIFLTIS